MGGFQCRLQSCFQLCCPSSHQMDPENFPSKKPIPCRCLESLLQRKRCSGLVEGELWSLCLAGSRTGNWERWTDPCGASSILQQSDFHHKSTFATRITSHSSLLLSGCNSASQGLASLSKKPLMCCRAASPCRTWISAPAWLLAPFLTSKCCGSCSHLSLWLHSPWINLCFHSPTALVEGWPGKEGKITLALLSPCYGQVLCPPSPPWSCAAEEAGLRATCYEKLLQSSAKLPGLNSQPEADIPLGTWMSSVLRQKAWAFLTLWNSNPRVKSFLTAVALSSQHRASHLHYHASQTCHQSRWWPKRGIS